MIEMAPGTNFRTQLAGAEKGPVVLINHFSVLPEYAAEFLKL